MRTHLNAATALLLTALMLTSLFAIQQHNPVEVLPEDDLSFDEPLLTSGRSSSTSILAAGSGANSEFGDHIEALPNGGWVVGSEFNSTLTYGSKTLSPTSPYATFNGGGEFFLAIMDEKGAWSNLVGADHNYGSGGLSFITDITVEWQEKFSSLDTSTERLLSVLQIRIRLSVIRIQDFTMKDSLRKQTQWVTGCGQKVSQP